MIDPKTYQSSNDLQRRGVSEILEVHSGRIQWNRSKEERVLDVGCGDGGVTAELLRAHVPGHCAKLTGCDISEEMVRHANLHHKDDRTEFRVLDIAGEVPVDMVEGYDHVFSFYTLHWVKNQKRALSNIHAMLVPGGDCLLALVCQITMYDLQRDLANTTRWGAYMEDIDDIIYPYYDSAAPDHELAQLMRESGFTDVEVQLKEKFYTFDDFDGYNKFVRAVSHMKSRLSGEEFEEFSRDYIQLSRDRGALQGRSSEEDSNPVNMRYTMLVAYGVK